MAFSLQIKSTLNLNISCGLKHSGQSLKVLDRILVHAPLYFQSVFLASRLPVGKRGLFALIGTMCGL